MAVGDFVVLFQGSKQMEEEEQGRREEVYLSERLGCADGEVGGMGGGSEPIHISGIWPENELVLFSFFFFGGGLEKFSSGEIFRNGAKHP